MDRPEGSRSIRAVSETGRATATRLAVMAMGGLAIVADDARVDHRIPEKASLMIVYLADTGAPARRSRLAGLLWSDLPEDRARANLRVTLTRLRSALGELLGADRERVWLTVEPTYDATSVATGDSSAIVEHYAGDFLSGIDVADAAVFMDWVDARRESLRTSAMLSLSEDLSQARRDGDWTHGTLLASRIVELEAWNEPAHRFLMEAEAVRGGRTAALAQYQRCTEALADSLGLEPDEETRALAASLGRGTSTSTPDTKPVRTSSAIPFDMTPFLGREHEVEQILERVSEGHYRLVTVAGPGGVGKTRLAAEVARQLDEEHPGCVVWAPLTSASTPQEFASTLTELLVDDAVFSQVDPLAQLTAAIGGRELYLILDNVEQLVASCTDLLLDLLRACPDVTALVTSRRVIDVAAEDVFVLAGLPTPGPGEDVGQSASVRLFVDRAYRANKSFALNEDNAEAVAQLCSLVDGVPLHLELAAARVSRLTVHQLVDHLREHASLPGDGPKGTPDRHRSFDAVFEQSWGLLTPDDQRALARLSVTRGGFERTAAATLLDSDGSEPIHLARMSLLAEERGGRFRFHELLRQSAASRLSADDRIQAEVAHAKWYLGLVAAARLALLSSQASETAKPLLLDLENIRQAWNVALQRGLTEAAAQAADGLAHLFELAGRAIETEQLMAAAASACADGTLPTTATADEAFFTRIQARQRAAWSMDDGTAKLCTRIAELLRDRPDRAHDLAWSQLHHAQAAYHLGDLTEATDLLERSEATGAPVDDESLRAWSLLQRGRILSATSHFDTAAHAFQEAIERFVAADDQRGHAQSHAYLAVTYAEQDRAWDAFVADRTAFELCEATGNRQLLSGRHENVAASFLLLGDYENARHHTAQALAMYRRNAEFDMESYALAQHGECLLGLGDVDAGEQDMSAGIAMMRDEEFSFGLLYNLPPWIRHLQRQGRHDQALLAAEEHLEIGTERGADHFVLTGEAHLARSHLGVGEPDRAQEVAGSVWDKLQVAEPPRLPWRLGTLLDLASVFEATEDDRLGEVIASARQTHRDTARSIADPELRRCYLDNHTASLELAAVIQRGNRDPS